MEQTWSEAVEMIPSPCMGCEKVTCMFTKCVRMAVWLEKRKAQTRANISRITAEMAKLRYDAIHNANPSRRGL